jgi:DNA-binding NarL/FixJ family response regulator
VIATLIGLNVRARRLYVTALVDHADHLVREREHLASIATAAERNAIAREMHDIVSHGLAPVELLASIRAVAAGDAAISSRVSRRMLDLFSQSLPSDPTSTGGEAVTALTPREMEILAAIAGGLTNTEIAERAFVTESTVKSHVGRILMKLGLRDRVHAVIFAYEHGLTGFRRTD